MSDSSDREKTMHLTTPRSTQGSNEENLTPIEHGYIDYVCMKASQYCSSMHERGTRYYIKSRNMHGKYAISWKRKPMYKGFVKRIKRERILRVTQRF
jgi:hypothetical protein